MKPHFPIFLLSRIVIVWLPYLGLQLYWQHLIATVPDAAHGELSGPVQFFLPVLFIAATLFSVVFIAGFYFTRPRSTRLSK